METNVKLARAFDKIVFILAEAAVPESSIIKVIAQAKTMLGFKPEQDVVVKTKAQMAATVKEMLDDSLVDRSERGSGAGKAGRPN
jgi:hypothetical protein